MTGGDDLVLFKQYKEMTEKIAYHFLILFEKCQVIPPVIFIRRLNKNDVCTWGTKMNGRRGWVVCAEDASIMSDTHATVKDLFEQIVTSEPEEDGDDRSVREWFEEHRPPLAKSYEKFVETPIGRAVLDFHRAMRRRKQNVR
jgi:hypothetical protein